VRCWLALLGTVAALLLVPGATFGGNYATPPGDVAPVWSPDGTRVAFLTGRDGPSLATVAAVGSPETRLLGLSGNPSPLPSLSALSPDWRFAAVLRPSGESLVLSVVGLDGSEERPLAASTGARPAWSPDSRWLAYRTPSGILVAQEVAGSGFVRLAEGAWSAAWSPDGSRIAYSAGDISGRDRRDLDVYVVDADGRNVRRVAGGERPQSEQQWSPDGSRIAFLTQRAAGQPFVLAVVRADGSTLRRYDRAQAGTFAWTPDSRAIVYARAGGQGLIYLDLATGRGRRITSFGDSPAVSPDGTRVAFSGGGECRDRLGIYVASIAGARLTRITNDCRILGTPSDDVLRGEELADVLVGLEGDDRLLAYDPGYMGDTLLGGEGDDRLIGAYRNDTLRGGLGRDRLRGGSSHDVLSGGPGRDRLEGQAGRDWIYARDGERDVVLCGTNLDRRGDRDEVWADRIDWVSRDCERVYRDR
jgi:Tol biopolymer transport system component